MSNWLLYIGIFFLFTGFGTPIGIVMIALYFLGQLKNVAPTKQYNDNTFNINNLNVVSDSTGFGKDDLETPMDHMSKESREEMR
jgi:hypothetical protein|tara:strand:+ start:258 stop:509 length:252 start_codon:yes stop_codon:yes gene_type:complete